RLKSEGYAFDLPVFVDYEYGKILNAVPSVADRTYLLEYEMACLGNAGYYSGMYMNTNWALNYVNARELQNKGFDMWIADFRGYNGYAPDVAFWQYTSTGSVSGVNGNCDISHSYKNYSDLIHGGSGGGGGSTPSETMFTVFDLNTNKPVTDTKLNIIAAITNNEIGNMSLSGEDFRNLCKAQAVAANSWVQHQYENQGTIPNVGLKYSGNYGAVKEAIFDVQSKVITYNG
ncbi:MAG: GH25 family lysozyme, partial [Oscillospiraceae bacterium]